MENKKEPLMSAEEFLHKIYFEKRENVNPGQFYPEPPTTEKIDDCKAYANYVTQWHLNNAKEFVWNDFDIDKQSIHTAIDNYIEINL